jgi:SpoVK/Ycf46/Vps4 family AAA+-type ATPase
MFKNLFNKNKSNFESLTENAMQFYSAKQYEKALENFLKIADVGESETTKANTYFLIGECYFALSDFEMATDYYRRALAISPNDANLKMKFEVAQKEYTQKLRVFKGFDESGYQQSDSIPDKYIDKRWKEGFYITSAAFGVGKWAIVTSKGSGYTDQIWRTRVNFPEEEIRAGWSEKKDITEICYGDGMWFLVMSENTGFTDQVFKFQQKFPTEYVNDMLTKRYRITNVAASPQGWCVVLSKGTPYTEQVWQTSTEFPKAKINELWDKGFAITEFTGDSPGYYVLVMSKGSGITNQTWSKAGELPEKFINEDGWKKGYDLTDIGFSNYEWMVTMSKPEETEDEEEVEEEEIEEEEADETEALYGPEAAKWVEKGDKFFENEEWDKALTNYEKALKIEPDCAYILYSIGATYSWKDDDDQAVAWYKKALAENEDYGECVESLINALSRLEKYKEILRYAQKMEDIGTENHNVLNNIGISYYELGDYDHALDYYKRALKFDPKNEVIKNNIKLAKEEKAENGSKNIMAKPSNLTNLEMAELMASDENWEEAIDYFEAAHEEDPEDDFPLYRMGECYLKLDDKQNARKYLEQASELNPGDPDIEEAMKNLGTGSSYSPVSGSIDDIMKELDELVGMTSVKDDFKRLIKFVEIEKLKREEGMSSGPLSLHTVFSGPPGTGKTTVARLIGRFFKATGILSKGHVVEVKRADLVGDAWGTTGPKTEEVVKSALDGVLFIDEAYMLKQSSDDSFGQEAIDTLLQRMENDRERLVVVVAGYSDEIKAFIETNPGLKSRFTRYINFKDYEPAELLELFKRNAKDYQIDEACNDKLARYFEFIYKRRDKTFGNGRDVRNLLQNILQYQSERLHNLDLTAISKEERKSVLRAITLEDVTKATQAVFEDEPMVSPDKILAKLNTLVGMKPISDEILKLIDFINLEKKRKEQGISTGPLTLHCVFQGPPGTGKTTVARMMGQVFKAMGILSKGHVVETKRSDLVGDAWGTTGPKTEAVINTALDGILFIDEAYMLKQKEDDVFGQDAIDTLLQRMENDRERLIVIIAGYENEIKELIKSNAGLQSRFTKYFTFKDYTPDELMQIFKQNAAGYSLEPAAEEKLAKYFDFSYKRRTKSFANGRFVRNTLQSISENMSSRISKLDSAMLNGDNQKAIITTITLADVEATIGKEFTETTADSLDKIKEEINKLIGMDEVKKEIGSLINYVKVAKLRAEKGLVSQPLSLHTVFYGPPGTGKTTIARIMGRIYKSLGLLTGGHVVEVDRSGLVSKWKGDTGDKVNQVIQSALDGVLFIDEAYTLKHIGNEEDELGQEAIDTLLKGMEDNRNRLVVIAAGYYDEMQRFIEANPGLKSRFTRYFNFVDYKPEELLAIFKNNCQQAHYTITEEAEAMLLELFRMSYEARDKSFANGRFARNAFDKATQILSDRIALIEDMDSITHEVLTTITLDDIETLAVS